MIPERDAGRLVRAFLDDGEPVLPAHVFAAVMDEVPRVRQRRRHGLPGPGTLRELPAATAILLLVLALLGLALAVGAMFGFGPVSPTPRPFPTGERTLVPGRYVIDRPFPTRISLDVPEGWVSTESTANLAELREDRPGGPALLFTVVEGVYEDPCHYERGLIDPIGASVGDLAVALTSLGRNGLDVSGPRAVDVGGRPGLALSMRAPASMVGCTPGDPPFPLWGIPQTFAPGPGEIVRIHIVPVDGVRLVIVGYGSERAEAGIAATEVLMSSIRLGADAPQATDVAGSSAPPPSQEAPPEPPILPLPERGAVRAGAYLWRLQLYERGPDGRAGALPRPHDVVLAVPDGWLATEHGVRSRSDRATAMSIETWALAGIHPDPCHWRAGSDRAAPVDDLDGLVALLRNGWSTAGGSAPSASEPADVPWNGKYAWSLELTVPATIDLATCDEGQLRLWDAPDGTGRATFPGEHIRLRVVDLDPGLAVLAVGSPPDVSLTDAKILMDAGASVAIVAPPEP